MGGVLIYIREDIPCKLINGSSFLHDFEGLFLEINLRKTRWLLFGGYNPHKSNIDAFLGKTGPVLEKNMTKLECFLIVGDFNSETCESSLIEFCQTYNLKNLVTGATCFKSVSNPSSIDLMLTNKPRNFLNNMII